MADAKGSRKMPKRTAEEKALLAKLRELREYGERTGDWEPIRRIKALLEDNLRALAEVKQIMEVPTKPPVKTSRGKRRA
jgi:hypothetical protein